MLLRYLLAISLLANLLGISGITAKVREIIEGIQATVHGAIRKLIRKVKGLFESDPEAGGEKPTFGEASFTAGTGEGGRDEGHRIFADTSGAAPKVMVASTPQEVKPSSPQT